MELMGQARLMLTDLRLKGMLEALEQRHQQAVAGQLAIWVLDHAAGGRN